MDRSQLVRLRLGTAGFAGGEASDASPPAAVNRLSCPAGRLLRGFWEGTPQVEAASALAKRGAAPLLPGQHQAAESRVGVLCSSHSSPRAAAVGSSSMTAEVTL